MRSLAAAKSSNAPNAPQDNDSVTVASGEHFCFHYRISHGVCFLTLTERAYPKRLAFDYLEELRNEFVQLYGAQVQKASRPYEFIRFDTFIQKTKKLYVDSRTQRNLDKLNVELRDVHNIMTRNINEVISRGERMESTCPRIDRLSSLADFFCVYVSDTRCRSISSEQVDAVRAPMVLLTPFSFCTRVRDGGNACSCDFDVKRRHCTEIDPTNNGVQAVRRAGKAREPNESGEAVRSNSNRNRSCDSAMVIHALPAAVGCMNGCSNAGE